MADLFASISLTCEMNSRNNYLSKKRLYRTDRK